MRIFLYVASIAVLTMLLMLVGHFKDKTLPIELANRLYRQCAKNVIDYLKENETASLNDIKKCISGVTASVFWSRKKLGVTNPAQFSERVADNMIKQGLMVEELKNGKKVYKLNTNQ